MEAVGWFLVGIGVLAVILAVCTDARINNGE